MNDQLLALCQEWRVNKDVEEVAKAERRRIEDEIRELAGIKENMDGTESLEADAFVLKIVGRIDRKVDSDKVQELAAEHGLTEHLSTLFRWTPEINMSAWSKADESITRPLAGAITAKGGRPSFKLIDKE